MTRDEIINDYFEWLYDLMCGNRYAEEISFRKLLMYLHSTEFIYSIRRDANRASDGIKLRRRYGLLRGFRDAPDCLDEPCSVLEMMIALAIHCEEDIMDDASIGDRTSQWFWGMITNLGLGSMVDDKFDRRYVEMVVRRFLRRKYEPDGRGGLFTIRDCSRDLRKVEIWYQLCWYLNSIT